MKSSTRKAMKQHEASKWIGMEGEDPTPEEIGDEPMSLSDGTGVDLAESWKFPEDPDTTA